MNRKPQTPNRFLEAVIQELPRSLEPALTHWLFRHGCLGTQELLDFVQDDLKYEPKVRAKKFITMSAFFESKAKEELEVHLKHWCLQHAPQVEIRWKLQENQDWLKEWKKHFKSFEFAGLNFVPVWKNSKKNRLRRKILIEPGMAFGTGTHATTRFAIQLLKELQKLNHIQKKTVLDVGAGSGILSVVAEKLGAKKICAIDNDPEAWRECGKMFELNKTKNCSVTSKQLLEVKKKFDIVVANIIDGVLIDLKPLLWRAAKKNGYIVLSGILTVGATAFIQSFLSRHKGLVIKELSEKEWTAFLIKVR